MKPVVHLLFTTVVLSALLSTACAGPEDEDVASTESAILAADLQLHRTPRKGIHLDVEADRARLGCALRVTTRGYDFPAGAGDPSVSVTGKTMCFTLDDTVHCHVSGTETGFCFDAWDNVRNAVENRPTPDGDFVRAFVTAHPNRHVDVSGHSQGAYDASRVAPLLGAGDQLVLLQPAAAALVPNEPLVDAACKGARVVVGWSPNDHASFGIRAAAGSRIPLLTFPRQTGIRVHSAPNARDLLFRAFAVPDGKTSNPALDASIISNPGSPRGAWRFPEWEP